MTLARGAGHLLTESQKSLDIDDRVTVYARPRSTFPALNRSSRQGNEKHELEYVS